MKDKLLALHKNSYCPISHYPVAAIVTTKDGKEFCGVNVEDASTRAGICAERAAIINAISAGYKKGDFKELYVMAASSKIATPCFVCRQLISEFFDKKDVIYCYQMEGKYEKYTVEELCPYPFGEKDLL